MKIDRINIMSLESEIKHKTNDKYKLRYKKKNSKEYIISVNEEHEEDFKQALINTYSMTSLYHFLQAILAVSSKRTIEKYYIKDLKDGEFDIEKVEYSRNIKENNNYILGGTAIMHRDAIKNGSTKYNNREKSLLELLEPEILAYKKYVNNEIAKNVADSRWE